jgi:LacI family transcriptional regulator
MVRLKDIAERAGVSIMTVSKALRDEHDVSANTKTRVKLLAQQMGYVPDSTAQGLRMGTTRLLGVAVPAVADPFFSRMVMAIEERAYERRYDVVLAQTLDIPEREDACIRRLLARRVDGMLLAPVYRISTGTGIYQEILNRQIPTVLLGPAAPFCAQFPAIECDDLLASAAVTRHLLGFGHKRIAFLTGPAGAPWATQRFEGYRRALREHGEDVNEKLVFHAGRSSEDGAEAARQLLTERCGATAIQASSDPVALGCAKMLLKMGFRIPEKVSVAGFGDIPEAEYFTIPLTTVRQPKYNLGSAAVSALHQLLQGKSPDTRPLHAELIVRSSTGIASATP